MSLYTLTFFGFTPFGNLALGALSQAIGINVAILLFAVLMFGASSGGLSPDAAIAQARLVGLDGA